MQEQGFCEGLGTLGILIIINKFAVYLYIIKCLLTSAQSLHAICLRRRRYSSIHFPSIIPLTVPTTVARFAKPGRPSQEILGAPCFQLLLMARLPSQNLMQSERLLMPYRLHRKSCGDLRGGQIGPGLEVGARWQFLHLVDEPLILEFGIIVRVARVIEMIEDFEDLFAVAERESAVHAFTVCAVDRCADEIVLKEIFDHARRVSAQDAVGLEEEEMPCWGKLVVEPWLGEEFTDGTMIGQCDI